MLQYIRHDNPVYGLGARSLFKVSKVRLKTLKLGIQSKCVWFLELYISGSINSEKVIFCRLKPPPSMILEKAKISISK